MVRTATPLIFLPLLVWGISLIVPYFSMIYFWSTLVIMVPFVLFMVSIDVTGKNRSRRMLSYAGYISLLLTSIFFGGPAFKLAEGSIFLQILMIFIALVILFFAQKYNEIIADSLTVKENRNIKFIITYYGFALLLLTAAGGGTYWAPMIFASKYGDEAMFAYYSTILLLVGYWLLILTQSATSRFKTFKK